MGEEGVLLASRRMQFLWCSARSIPSLLISCALTVFSAGFSPVIAVSQALGATA